MSCYLNGLIVGRFQSVHYGHVHMIQTALNLCEKVVILIGSAQESLTPENPFSYGIREQMLVNVFADEIKEGRLAIYPLIDIGAGNCETWGKHVLETCKACYGYEPDLYITGCEKNRSSWFSEEIAPDLNELRLSRSAIPTSASQCRKWLLEDNFEAWKQRVPVVLHKNYDQYRALVAVANSDKKDY